MDDDDSITIRRHPGHKTKEIDDYDAKADNRHNQACVTADSSLIIRPARPDKSVIIRLAFQLKTAS